MSKPDRKRFSRDRDNSHERPSIESNDSSSPEFSSSSEETVHVKLFLDGRNAWQHNQETEDHRVSPTISYWLANTKTNDNSSAECIPIVGLNDISLYDKRYYSKDESTTDSNYDTASSQFESSTFDDDVILSDESAQFECHSPLKENRQQRFRLPDTLTTDHRTLIDERRSKKLFCHKKEKSTTNNADYLQSRIFFPLANVCNKYNEDVNSLFRQYLEDIEQKFMHAYGIVITGAEEPLVLPATYTQSDKEVFLKRRHLRRNGIHITDKKNFTKLLELYRSMKSCKNDVF